MILRFLHIDFQNAPPSARQRFKTSVFSTSSGWLTPGAKIIPKGDMSAFGANLEAIAKGEVTVAAQ